MDWAEFVKNQVEDFSDGRVIAGARLAMLMG